MLSSSGHVGSHRALDRAGRGRTIRPGHVVQLGPRWLAQSFGQSWLNGDMLYSSGHVGAHRVLARAGRGRTSGCARPMLP